MSIVYQSNAVVFNNDSSQSSKCVDAIDLALKLSTIKDDDNEACSTCTASTAEESTCSSSAVETPARNHKRSIFASYWEKNPQTKKAQNQEDKPEDAMTRPRPIFKASPQDEKKVSREMPPRRKIFESSPSGNPREELARLAALYRPDPIGTRKSQSTSVLDRRPTKSLLKKTQRYSGPPPYGRSKSSVQHHRSVSFNECVHVLQYTIPIERYAKDGWADYFA